MRFFNAANSHSLLKRLVKNDDLFRSSVLFLCATLIRRAPSRNMLPSVSLCESNTFPLSISMRFDIRSPPVICAGGGEWGTC